MASFSDISGTEFVDGTGGVATLHYANSDKTDDAFDLSPAEVAQLLDWAKAAPGGIVLKPGRRSGRSGRVIAPSTGATLRIAYADQEGDEQHFSVNLTDDEVATLTNDRLARSRIRLAGTLAIGGGLVIAVLAAIAESGWVAKHPIWTLFVITVVTIAIATLWWKAFERVSSRAVVLATGLGVVLTTLFAVAPNLKPETAQSLSMETMSIERGLPLADFYGSRETQYIFRNSPESVSALVNDYCRFVHQQPARRHASCPPSPKSAVVLYIPVHSVGLTTSDLTLHWVLFNAATHAAVRAQPVDSLPVSVRPEKRDSDFIIVPVWVDTTVTTAKKAYIRAYLSAQNGQLLATATSPIFAVVSPR